jgi:hypothetical protein
MVSTTSTVFVPGWRWIGENNRSFVIIPTRQRAFSTPAPALVVLDEIGTPSL